MGQLLLTLLSLMAAGDLQETQPGARNVRIDSLLTFYAYNSSSNSTEKITDSYILEKNKPVKFIIHGWTDNGRSEWVGEMQEIMAHTGRWSVISVNWSPISYASFRDAYERCEDTLGYKLAQFTSSLARPIPPKFIHFVAHGLGVLIALKAAQKLNERTKRKIHRLTALDPCELDYTQEDFRKAARFVDVIHTNGDELGTMRPVGHVDYYPNGGQLQPGCHSAICSHTRACEYWTASIKDAWAFKAFWEQGYQSKDKGYKVSSYPMGIGAYPTMPWGAYFLETTDQPPHILSSHNLI